MHAPVLNDVFRERVSQSRTLARWSQADLTRATATVGHRVPQSVLSRIELGTRVPRLSEALAVIAALGLAPDYLLTPLDSDAPMRFGDDDRAPVYRAGEVAAWLHGDAALPDTDGSRYLWGAGPTGRNTVATTLRGLVKHAEQADDPDTLMRVARAGIDALTGLLASLELDADQEG